MTVYLVIGIEFLGLIALPVPAARRAWMLILAAALWHCFMGVRIWQRVRRCRAEFPDSSPEPDMPVDGALLIVYALAGVVLISKLCALPWLLSPPDNRPGALWVQVACVIFMATVLLCGSVVVHARYRRWLGQGPIDLAITRQIDELAPPRWVLGAMTAIPFAIALLMTFVTLTHDVLPVYVPVGDTAVAVARRLMFLMTLLSMDFVVLMTLPLAYLRRRIPRIVWGTAIGLVGLIGTLHLGLFAKTIIAAPVVSATPRYATLPRLEPSAGHFVVEDPPDLLASDRRETEVGYPGGQLSLFVRFAPGATIGVEYDGHKAQLTIPERGAASVSEVTAMVMVVPHEFRRGFPSALQVSLVVVHAESRKQESEQFELPLPADISASDWNTEYEFIAREREKEYRLGETVSLGTVQGKPLMLKVDAAPLAR